MTERPADQPGEPIAVIGLAGRFPAAADPDQLWHNLCQGMDGVSRPDPDQLASVGVTTEELRHPDYVRAVALMPAADSFDAELFGMTPRDAAILSPQHRTFLETAHAALENAGYDPFAVPVPTGVFGGSSVNGYLLHQLWGNPAIANLDTMTLGVANNSSYLPTLTSYKLSLRGPSVAVATACSTSLVALHLAIGSLREGSCAIAVAGGVEIEFPYGHGYRWTPGSAYSRLGACRPFDADADGTVFGSGVGVVVLKRLREALADGDPIRAVIRGSAVNNDGADKVSFSAPSMSGQVAVIKAALASAGVNPSEIGYVEAHGTGTRLGDPLEVAALARAYRDMATDPLPAGSILLGSVKSNIGHLGPAAGVAGLIKAIYSLEHEQVPPTIHYRTPNPEIDFPATPFVVNDRPHAWPRSAGGPRFAAVSSFGVGGTNAHVIVEEAPARPARAGSGRPRLLLWSARGEEPLEAMQTGLATWLAGTADHTFDDIAYTSQLGRTHHPVRAAAVCAATAEAVEVLRTGGRAVQRGGSRAYRREVCFMFPGQGSQQVRMAVGLYKEVPRFAAVLDECLDLFAENGVDLREAWRGDADGAVDHTSIAQPLLFGVELAMAHALMEAGVRPETVFGHSLGEIVAASVAGVFELPDAVRLVAARARLMGEMPPGEMFAVPVDPADLADLASSGVVLAAVNGPRQSVLSGPAERASALRKRLAEQGIECRPLRTSHAFHSPSMAPAAERFLTAVRQAVLRPPAIRMVSAATGHEVSAEQAVSADFWADQLVEPVLFGAAADHTLADGPKLVLEVGPAQALTGLLRGHPAVRRGGSSVVPVAPRVPGEDADLRAFLTALGAVHVDGHELRWPVQPTGRRVSLPGYHYQRKRFWIEHVEAIADRSAADAGPAPGAEPQHSPFAVIGWEQAPASVPAPAPAHRRALALLPTAASEAASLLGGLYRAGHHVWRVRAGEELSLGEEEFVVRPGVTGDLTAVLDELQHRGLSPHTLVHAWATIDWAPPASGRFDNQLADGCFSLLELARAGMRRPVAGAMPELVVLTSGAVDVSGSELVHPLKSMAVGIVTTLGMEAPGARCRMIDIGGSIDPEQLATELRCSPAPALVALRGSRRWVPAERALDLPSHDRAALREQGVYLITGGLSGIGLELARGLARTGLRPRLALLGRRVPDGEPPLPEPAAARVRMTVSEMEALGAVVRIESCDVADAAQLRRALDRVGVAFGPINGVVHSAGVPGDGVIQLRRPSDALRVWRPKVLGTLLLHEYLQTEHRPDFFVSCSSRAGTYGLIGSGDYAAANAFLDAHAATAWDRTRALSIGWPSWREVGMAARAADTASPEELSGEVVLDEVMDAATHWVLDEHRLGDLPLLPGTGQLELVVRAFRRQAGRAAIRLEDVIFLRPLVAETAVRVQVVASSGQGLDRFTVRSHQPVRGWTEHTTGRVRLVDPAQRHVDLAALEARIAGQVPPALPAEPEAGVVAFGPRWRNLGRQVRGQDEDLVELVLPDEFQADLREHPLHPALLDDATATAQRATGTSQLPFMYQALTVFDSLPARCWVHLGYRPDDRHGSVVDAELIGVDGRVIVAVEGFRMRPVDRERLPGGPRAQTGPPGGEPGAARHHPGVGDLSPETGVELFLRLLNTRTPPHVLVRPYEDAPPQQPASASRAAALPARPAASVPARAAGTDELKTTIRAFWTEATGIDGIGDDDDFFELGGDSLTAIQLMSQIRDSYGVELSIALLFEHPTVALLATAIRDEAGSS